jgi:DNA processing protein
MCPLGPADPAGLPVQPHWDASDVLALSFVVGLPRTELFSILRGEVLILRDEAKAADTSVSVRPDEVPEAQTAGGAACAAGPTDPLEGVLAALGCDRAAERAATARSEADVAVRNARRRGIEAVPWVDPRYPALVAGIFDPPLVLWLRGAVTILSATAVAIVGSRAASVYGEETAARLASDLAARGLVIVSGLARGIDAAAHRGALAAGGRTVAVLGCGVDVVYPPEHAALMDEVARTGAVVSEFPPGMPPLPCNFPRRNRIISALSLGVVVVEARQRSGALITADCALEQGREVMAVPGSVLSERHRGSHTLLKAGAGLVETADDVLEVLKLGHEGGAATGCAVVEDPLVAAMDAGEAYALDALATMSGHDAATLLPRLLELELQGFVRRLPGGRFVRSGGTC